MLATMRLFPDNSGQRGCSAATDEQHPRPRAIWFPSSGDRTVDSSSTREELSSLEFMNRHVVGSRRASAPDARLSRIIGSMWKAWLAFSIVLGSAPLVLGAPSDDNPWPSFLDPSAGPAHSIGDYSAGCLQGAQLLPLDGVGYQVMRPSRRRYFGHPALVDFVRALARHVYDKGLGVLLVGDLSQPRGGPTASGHASHQTGLDVDIWFWHPEHARHAPLPLLTREQLIAESVVDLKARAIRAQWREHVSRVLRLTADDQRVERVFVNPVIKRELCRQRSEERAWLRKIRPWPGHDDHFHVRLSCLPGDSICQAQAPLPPGDGCDKLTLSLERAAQKEHKAVRQDSQQAVTRGHSWPERCNELLGPTWNPRPALASRTRRQAEQPFFKSGGLRRQEF